MSDEMEHNSVNNGDNTFVSSLNSLTVDDVAPARRSIKTGNGFSGTAFFRIVTVLLCIAVLLYCVFELTEIVDSYRRGNDLYSEIEKSFWAIVNGNTDGGVSGMSIAASDTPMANYSDVLQNGPPIYTPSTPSGDERFTSPMFQKVLTFIQACRDENPDTYGHIMIPNTKINFPIVRRDDNDFYLKHDFKGNHNAVGAIFVDCRNSIHVEENRNIVIYGHNMLNGTMFNDIESYLKEDFFMDTSNDIVITTFDAMYTFRVFSVYPTNAYDKYFKTHFSGDNEFLEFCRYREEKSLYHRDDISFEPDDVLITLSTCILGKEDGRYAIHAKLIKIDK
ncbi:MAG: class B sortase [Eubacteriales bacterium]